MTFIFILFILLTFFIIWFILSSKQPEPAKQMLDNKWTLAKLAARQLLTKGQWLDNSKYYEDDRIFIRTFLENDIQIIEIYKKIISGDTEGEIVLRWKNKQIEYAHLKLDDVIEHLSNLLKEKEK